MKLILGFAVTALVVGVVGAAGVSPIGACHVPRASPGRSPSSAWSIPRMRRAAQIFSVARPGAKPRRLTSGGSGFNPDYSPDGERIVFERRYGGRDPGLALHDGLRRLVPGRRPHDLRRGSVPGRQQPRLVAGRQPAGVRARVRADRRGLFAAGLDLVTAGADGSNEQVILHFRSLEARARSRMTRSGRRMARGSR